MDKIEEDDFRDFVTARSTELTRRAYILTGGDAEAAKDLVQAALAKAIAHWRDLTDPMAFLRTVMYRQQISWWRRGWSRHETTTDAPPERATSDVAPTVEMRLAVRAALSRLTPRQRAVLFLRHYEDLPEADVAAILKCSVGTVRSTNHRALARLREFAPELAAFHDRSGEPSEGSGRTTQSRIPEVLI